jgi:polar amino acid transport system substrate-binding protein
VTKNTTKALLLLLLITAIVVVISGCTSSSPSATTTPTAAANVTVTPAANVTTQGPPNFTTITPGELLIPTDATFPPMEWLNTSPGLTSQQQFQGFDMDLMRAICAKLNVTPVFTAHDFSSIINDIETGKYDCSISSFSITPARQEMVSFSDPYFQVQQTIVVRANDSSIQNVTDLVDKNKVIAVELGTTGQSAADNLTGSNGTKINALTNVLAEGGADQAYTDLASGKADAVIDDIEVNAYYVNTFPASYKFVNYKFPTLEPYGIVVSKNNPQLLAAINWALAQLQADGTMNQLKQKYGLE